MVGEKKLTKKMTTKTHKTHAYTHNQPQMITASVFELDSNFWNHCTNNNKETNQSKYYGYQEKIKQDGR